MHSLIRGVYFSITLKTIHRKDTYMKQPKLELLSPAGSWEALEAAVRSGAECCIFRRQSVQRPCQRAKF